MLKFKIPKLEDVEEQYRGLYSKGEDGNYYLSVEGAVDRSRLDEFRNNNIELNRRLEAFKDLDPTKVQEMMENERKIAEKKLIDAGDIDGLVASRVDAMKREYEGKIQNLDKQLGLSNRQLESLIIDNSVREHAIKLGVAPSAVDDVLLRAKTVYRVEDGKAIPKDSNGQVIYGADGQSPMALGTWIGGLKETAPHLFTPSTGSGSNNRGGTANNSANMSATQKIAAGLSAGGSSIVS